MLGDRGRADPKTTRRTVAIMRELLARTGDYGCPAAEITAGGPPRHTRVIYLCAPAARPTVTRARDALGSSGARVEIRLLPPGAAMAMPAGGRATRAGHNTPAPPPHAQAPAQPQAAARPQAPSQRRAPS